MKFELNFNGGTLPLYRFAGLEGLANLRFLVSDIAKTDEYAQECIEESLERHKDTPCNAYTAEISEKGIFALGRTDRKRR